MLLGLISLIFFTLMNVAIRKFEIIYVACIICLVGSIGPNHQLPFQPFQLDFALPPIVNLVKFRDKINTTLSSLSSATC